MPIGEAVGITYYEQPHPRQSRRRTLQSPPPPPATTTAAAVASPVLQPLYSDEDESDEVIVLDSSDEETAPTAPMRPLPIGEPSTSTGIVYRDPPVLSVVKRTSHNDLLDVSSATKGTKPSASAPSVNKKRKSGNPLHSYKLKRLKLSIAVKEAQLKLLADMAAKLDAGELTFFNLDGSPAAPAQLPAQEDMETSESEYFSADEMDQQ